ncbi:MAG: glycosyltransferase [Bacteroidales bacterium]|nr:glycosyltransferase [Bacteroidales bacterium]
MRVLFVGNQGNTGYRMVKWLLDTGVDAKLIIPYNSGRERSLPEWEDPSLENNYPEWILTYRENRYPYLFLNSSLRKTARHYDLVLVTGFHVLPALKLRKPLIFLPVGRDLSQMPFWSGKLVDELQSWLYRSRVKNLSLILTEQEDCIWAARLLGVGSKIRRFPFLIDIHKINKNVNRELEERLKEKYRSYDWIFLNPSRKNLDPDRKDYKGSEKLLNAYKKFLTEHQDTKVLMISGLHGLHIDEYTNMVKKLGLENHIEFTGHLSLPELYAFYTLDHLIVFDQFIENLNTLGGVQREALAMGCPVVSSTDIGSREFIVNYGPECPLIPAFDENEILNAMKQVTDFSSEEIRQYKADSKAWAFHYLHYASRMDEFTGLLKEAVNIFHSHK